MTGSYGETRGVIKGLISSSGINSTFFDMLEKLWSQRTFARLLMNAKVAFTFAQILQSFNPHKV